MVKNINACEASDHFEQLKFDENAYSISMEFQQSMDSRDP